MDTNVRDTLGRHLHDLRVSVIDRCNLRCTYCMPADKFNDQYEFMPASDRLSLEELARVVHAFTVLGVTKVRLTGGEPLLRSGLIELVEQLADIERIEDLALTSNGVLLPRYARGLKKAGLDRITISLDTLDEDVFGIMNGRGEGTKGVLAGIKAAEDAGFESIKVNVVVQKGMNDHTLLDLVEHFRETGHVLRFIEYMDVGTRNQWRMEEVVPSVEILARISDRFPVVSLEENYTGEVASRYAFEDGKGEIGFISSVTKPFCGTCNRARISADGTMYTCLFANEGTDLRQDLHAGISDEDLVTRIAAIWRGREDRYSELRAARMSVGENSDKIEMFRIGG
jgi:cyclic pyranopterin phosphate synthase